MPGKADCISLRCTSTGEKVKKQKRHLVMTISEAHRCFLADNIGVIIGRSKFAELRPKWVLLSSEMPHNVCGCKYHANIILLLEALHRRYPNQIQLYTKETFTARCVCDVDNEVCMTNNCKKCSNAKQFYRNIRDTVPEESYFKWHQWSEVNGYLQQTENEGSTTDAFNELAMQLPKFLWHSFVKEKQALSYNDAKTKSMMPDSTSCVLQMDFAENFTCQSQDEIQSAHWNQNQITLFTVMVYHRGENLSLVIVSDYRAHEKCAVTAFTVHVLEVIKLKMPDVIEVDI